LETPFCNDFCSGVFPENAPSSHAATPAPATMSTPIPPTSSGFFERFFGSTVVRVGEFCFSPLRIVRVVVGRGRFG
jgi:hypothetical protein